MFGQSVRIDVQPSVDGTSLFLKLELHPVLANVAAGPPVCSKVGLIIGILTDSHVEGIQKQSSVPLEKPMDVTEAVLDAPCSIELWPSGRLQRSLFHLGHELDRYLGYPIRIDDREIVTGTVDDFRRHLRCNTP